LKSLPNEETQGKRQPHPLLVGLDLWQRRARNHDKRHVAMGEMDERAVEMIGEIGAA
jgi:hypothetical protein